MRSQWTTVSYNAGIKRVRVPRLSCIDTGFTSVLKLPRTGNSGRPSELTPTSGSIKDSFPLRIL